MPLPSAEAPAPATAAVPVPAPATPEVAAAPAPATPAAPKAAPPGPAPSAPNLAGPVALPAIAGPPPPEVSRAPTNSSSAENVTETKVNITDPTIARGPEMSIILSDGKFRPSRIRLKAGETTRLLFTTLGHKPAALIIERLRVQKWLTRPEEAVRRTPSSAPWEVNRELSSNRLTEVALDPVRGNYTFHDAISGAAGEIVVE
jgi:hypothetical protein